MPVVSTEVLEILQGLGLDDERALRAASAVGEAQSAVNDATRAEVARLRGSIDKLRERLGEDLDAARGEAEAWREGRAAMEARLDTLAGELNAAADAQRKAAAAAAQGHQKTLDKITEALGALKWLLIALIALNLVAVVVSVIV